MHKRKARETQAAHEEYVMGMVAVMESEDSPKADLRQKYRNILRFQFRGYAFEEKPKCKRWGKRCWRCQYTRCRENELYDGEKFEYDFDPDVDRFSSLTEVLQNIMVKPLTTQTKEPAPAVPVKQNISLFDCITALAKQHYSD